MKKYIRKNYHFYNLSLKLRGLPVRAPARLDDLFVTGFPRSGNTSTAFCLKSMYPEKRISSHYHVEAGISFCKFYKIPCLVIIRNPNESVSSLFIKRSHKDHSISLNTISRYCYEYLSYLEEVMNNGHRDCVRVIRFEDVIDPEYCLGEKISTWLNWVSVGSYEKILKNYCSERLQNLTADRVAVEQNLPNITKSVQKKELIATLQENPYQIRSLEKYKILKGKALW